MNEKPNELDPTAQDEGQRQSPPEEIDSWEKAFAAFDEAHSTPAAGNEAGDNADTSTDAELGGGDFADDGSVDEGEPGGSVSDQSEPYDYADLEDRLSEINEEIEDQAIREVTEFLLTGTDDQGRPLVYHTNGNIGVSINDPDIYKVDENGIATFYNPDTGRPFTGDNPRAQAREWVNAYNEELKSTFNDIVTKHQSELAKESEPTIALLKFAPVYEGLDPVRQKMLDALIEDYEIYNDEDEHVGYSIDLNKALDQVNSQVARLQGTYSKQATQEGSNIPDSKPSGPVVDTPSAGSGSTAITGRPDFKNLAEALEWQEDQKLLQTKKGNN